MTTNDMPARSSAWMGRNVLVTGASGMIGSWLVRELLTLGGNVVALVRDADPQSELYRSHDIQRVRVVSGSLEEIRTLERAIAENGVDTIFHLGAQTLVTVARRSPLQTFESNIRGTYNLLEACRSHRDLVLRIVVASSDKAYGEQTNLPYTEEMALEGRQPYEVSKSCADMLSQCFWTTYELPVAVARCGNVYGGGDLNWSRIVPGTIRSCLLGERPLIRSDGSYVRDYTYVKDVVAGYIKLGEHMNDPQVAGKAFNFSAESPLSVLDLVRTIQRLLECEELEPQIENTAEGEIHSQYLRAERARVLLQWEARHSLELALGETIGWYRDFLL